MQSAVWGPSMWGFLHDWSFAVAARAPPDAPIPVSAVRLMTALSGVLPCTYCRHSYDIFLGSLGPLELVKARDFPRFVYDLHELVNDKLDMQHFKGVMRRGRRITFDTLVTRQQLKRGCDAGGGITAAVVLHLLFVLAYNYPEDDDAAPLPQQQPGRDTRPPHVRRQYYREWFSVLPAALRDAGGGGVLPDALEAVWVASCSAPTAPVCDALRAKLPDTAVRLILGLQPEFATQHPSRAAVFALVTLMRGLVHAETTQCLDSMQAFAAESVALARHFGAAAV